MTLIDEFNHDMEKIYSEEIALGQKAPYFRRMLDQYGGLETAKRLLTGGKYQLGFQRLAEIQRLDLTLEAYVIQEKYEELFTENEIKEANRRLNEFGYIDKISKENLLNGDYVYLKTCPEIPLPKTPTSEDCIGYEYMTMVQLCNIAEEHGVGRSKACNAFGGDKGKYSVLSVRKARVFDDRKFVLVSAVIDYFNEIGILW